MISIDVIDTAAAFGRLEPEWRALLASSRSDCMFLTWEWMHTWWRHLAADRALLIVTVRKDSKLIAIAPLIVSNSPMRSLEFLGSGSVGSDYLDFIVDRHNEDAAAEALAEFFTDAGFTLRLPALKEDSFVAERFSEMREWRARRVPMQVSPFVDISAHNWRSFLDALGPSHRYNFKRRLRNLEKNFSLRFEESPDALEQLIDLHLRRWNGRGGSDGLQEEGLRAFHRSFSALARDRGWLRLRVLTLDGHPAAAFYGFRYRDSYAFYQSGFDEKYSKQSVGLVMIGLTIREAIEEGAAEYDFLHGDESYKFLWARETRPLFRLELYPRGLRGQMHRNGVIAVAATKKLVKRVLNASLSR